MTDGKKGLYKMHKIGETQTGMVIVEMTAKQYEALQLLNGGNGQFAEAASEKILSDKVSIRRRQMRLQVSRVIK